MNEEDYVFHLTSDIPSKPVACGNVIVCLCNSKTHKKHSMKKESNGSCHSPIIFKHKCKETAIATKHFYRLQTHYLTDAIDNVQI